MVCFKAKIYFPFKDKKVLPYRILLPSLMLIAAQYRRANRISLASVHRSVPIVRLCGAERASNISQPARDTIKVSKHDA